ncbi:hypothetical protein [Singulisphaera sp. PoT]|uniref:hypothetical protein n=1 Tax=Singulisphaera sp. PoT TaxID=3411797 RepID=UPI003BF46DCB
MLGFHLARFSVDATPPMNHPLCGGWIKPVVGVDDPLSLRGIVLQGAGLPIVLATLDWTGVMNESHRLWTEALAEAAHTTPDRVALHCVHQHNAPFIDRDGNALLSKSENPTLLYDERFVDDLIKRSAVALRESLPQAQPITHCRSGEAEVKEVASNRRIIGPDGKSLYVRYSSTTDPKVRAEPIGTIDPMLKSIGFCKGDKVLARLYYYATHPMSYYGDGRVTSDFVGLARNKRDAEEPETLHLYFTGSSGNITPGKYNDGNHANRAILAERVRAAMAAADEAARPHETRLESIDWFTAPLTLEPREGLDLDQLKAIAADPKRTTVERNRSAMTCGWLIRAASKRPILLTRLDLGDVSVLHLPAETFIEYQLEAQKIKPGSMLATAAYGDGGPWYLPLQRSFAEGGYEPSVAFSRSDTEPLYRDAIAGLLRKKGRSSL